MFVVYTVTQPFGILREMQTEIYVLQIGRDPLPVPLLRNYVNVDAAVRSESAHHFRTRLLSVHIFNSNKNSWSVPVAAPSKP